MSDEKQGVPRSPTEEEKIFLETRRREEIENLGADVDDEEGVVEVPVGIYIEKPKKLAKWELMKREMKKIRTRKSPKGPKSRKSSPKGRKAEISDDERSTEDQEDEIDPDAEEKDYDDVEESEEDEAEKEAKKEREKQAKREWDEALGAKKKGKLGPDEMYEEGVDIDVVKAQVPYFPELEVFGSEGADIMAEMPEFWKKRLGQVPYARRRVRRSTKFGYTGAVKLKKTKLGFVPVSRRDDTAPPLVGVGEEFIYEEIPEEDLLEAQEKYRAQAVEQHGGNPEDVQIPYELKETRRIVDLEKKTTEELLDICRERKLKCAKLIKEFDAKYGDGTGDEDGNEENEELQTLKRKAFRRAVILKIENSLKGEILAKRTPRSPKRTPLRASPKKRTRQNPYNAKYPIGTRVQFNDRDGKIRKGPVINFAEPGITVFADKTEFKVRYENKTLKIISKAPSEKSEVKKEPSSEYEETYMKFVTKTPSKNDIYKMKDVPREMRERVVEVYVELLKEIRGISSEEKGPSEKVGGFSMVKPVPWDEYYENNFVAWRWQTYSGAVASNLDLKAISEFVKEESARQKDFDSLLALVLENLENDITEETTANDVIRGFNIVGKQRHYTPFEARFIEIFQKLNNEHLRETSRIPTVPAYRDKERIAYFKKIKMAKKAGLRGKIEKPRQKYFPDVEAQIPDVKGEKLAKMIDESIREYIKVTPDIDESLFINQQIREGLETYDQEVLRSMFDLENLDNMKKLHSDYQKQYDEEYAKYQASLEELQAKGKVNNVNDDDIIEEVKNYEEIIYLNHGRGKNVYTYLRKVLVPHIFMYGPIAAHAKFFRAKLANGMFQFPALVSANIAHYLPEFVMGIHNHTEDEIDYLFEDDPWETLASSIVEVTSLTVASFMDSYAAILNPTRRKEYNNNLSRLWQVGDPLVKILVQVVPACQRQTGTGRRPVVKNGKYVYRVTGRGANKRREMVMEDIPEGDLVICFANDKFSCHSVEEIATAIAKSKGGEAINIQTGKPYPKDFIERFLQQHRKIVDGISAPDDTEASEPLPKTPEIKPKTAARREEKKRHVPVKGKKFKEVTGLLLVGEQIDHIAGYMNELEIPLQGENTLIVDLKNEDSDDTEVPNVAIISFDIGSDDSSLEMENLAEQIDSISTEKDIYVLGVGKNITGKIKTITGARIKKLKQSKRVKQIFYSEQKEENILDAFIDVVIDVEGIKVRGAPEVENDEVPEFETSVPAPSGAEERKLSSFNPSKIQEGIAPIWTPRRGWRYSASPKVTKKSKKVKIVTPPKKERSKVTKKK